MRFLNKYSSYIKINSFLKNCPKRLLKFKRTKWKKLQNILNKKFYLKQLYNNNSVSKTSYKTWSKINLNYKEGLMLKKSLYLFYNNSVTTSFYKKLVFKRKNLTFNSSFFFLVLKPLFRIDILLWKLNFCFSTSQAQQFINSKLILINNKTIKSNCFVKMGDIITFNDNLIDLKLAFNKYIFFELFNAFFEIDYFTNTIIVIKDWNFVSFNSFNNFSSENFNLKIFLDYIRTK